LASTERGLRLIYVGILVMILAIILGMALSFVGPATGIITGLALFAGWLLWLIGPFFCLSVPGETGARGLIIASVTCQGTAAGLVLLQFAAPLLFYTSLGGIGGFFAVGAGVGQLLGLAGSVLFVLFMMKVGRQLGREDLHRRGRNLLILAVFIFIGLIALSVAMFSAISGPSSSGPSRLATAASGIAIAWGIAVLIAFIMYANLVHQLYKAISELRQQARTPATLDTPSPTPTFSEQPDDTASL